MNEDVLLKTIIEQVTPEEFIDVMDLDIEYLVCKFIDEIREYSERFDYLEREGADV